MDGGLTELSRLEPGRSVPARRPYAALFPYHAELCALSELRKKPGFGVPLRSGIGGHSLLYLNGVRRDRRENYPVLRMCAPDEDPAAHGVAVSVNSHYSNANWVAAEGHDFCLRGALAPGEALSEAGYARTQQAAKRMGLLEGVKFHEELFRAKPAGMSDADYMYEISVATDYAACFGRDVYRASLPLDAARMGAVVAYLNALNAPYRSGAKIYRWKLFNDNCCHVARNALAAAGIWAPWPTGQFFVRAMFGFPVPKNELVDLLIRANDLSLEDAASVQADDSARNSLARFGTLPAGPGALANFSPAIAANEIYDVKKLRLIFYDNPFWGPYRFHLERFLSGPRTTELAANLRHFSARYATARANLARAGRGDRVFSRLYARHLDEAAARTESLRRSLAAS